MSYFYPVAVNLDSLDKRAQECLPLSQTCFLDHGSKVPPVGFDHFNINPFLTPGHHLSFRH